MYVTWRQDGFQGFMDQVVGGLGASGVKVAAQADMGTEVGLCCFDP